MKSFIQKAVLLFATLSCSYISFAQTPIKQSHIIDGDYKFEIPPAMPQFAGKTISYSIYRKSFKTPMYAGEALDTIHVGAPLYLKANLVDPTQTKPDYVFEIKAEVLNDGTDFSIVDFKGGDNTFYAVKMTFARKADLAIKNALGQTIKTIALINDTVTLYWSSSNSNNPNNSNTYYYSEQEYQTRVAKRTIFGMSENNASEFISKRGNFVNEYNEKEFYKLIKNNTLVVLNLIGKSYEFANKGFLPNAFKMHVLGSKKAIESNAELNNLIEKSKETFNAWLKESDNADTKLKLFDITNQFEDTANHSADKNIKILCYVNASLASVMNGDLERAKNLHSKAKQLDNSIFGILGSTSSNLYYCFSTREILNSSDAISTEFILMEY